MFVVRGDAGASPMSKERPDDGGPETGRPAAPALAEIPGGGVVVSSISPSVIRPAWRTLSVWPEGRKGVYNREMY